MTREFSSSSEPVPPPTPARSLHERIDRIVAGLEEGLDDQIHHPSRRLRMHDSSRPENVPPLPTPAEGGIAELANRIVPTARFGEEIAERIRQLLPVPEADEK